jgi:uncharacterized protein with PQ loop repeat
MKYLQTYEHHNESIKSAVFGAALGASLFANSPIVSAKDAVEPVISNPAPKDGVIVSKVTNLNTAVEQVEYLSNIRKSELNPKDKHLQYILSEIQSKLESGDQEDYKELFDKLSSHVETKYGYKIEPKNLDELSEVGISEQTKGMSIFEIFGWLGSICLAICGIPQAWQSFKDKHSHGISWGFVLLWAFGEIFALAYVYDKLDLPLLLNYTTNILILGVILYFKINPKNTTDYDKEVRRFH